MLRIEGHRARLTALEVTALRTGVLAIVVGAVWAFVQSDARVGVPRVLGLAGLLALALCGAMRGVRLYRAGVKASLPATVGRTQVRIRPARGFIASSVIVALVLPLAAAVAIVAFVDWSWLLVAGVVLIGAMTAIATAAADSDGYCFLGAGADRAETLLQRLCIRADMPVPPLVVEYGARANAWTAAGRIHVTDTLLDLLDERELEAVLAHELAHLARRDAAVMEICSAPSRVLVGYANLVMHGVRDGVRLVFDLHVPWGVAVFVGAFALFCMPFAFVIGWVSRLSALGISRAREHSADAVAVTLTGSPSALASALMKLDDQREWRPRRDLREVSPMLCIVGTSRFRPFSTHPPIAARVRRLEALERRIQARSY